MKLQKEMKMKLPLLFDFEIMKMFKGAKKEDKIKW